MLEATMPKGENFLLALFYNIMDKQSMVPAFRFPKK